MKIDAIDHFVITVRDIEATCKFYSEVLGMQVITFGADQRKALTFGRQKINLHEAGKELEPKAAKPVPGSADFCLITSVPMPEIVKHLRELNITIEVEPSPRTGAVNKLESVYVRDPDGNLVEISNERP